LHNADRPQAGSNGWPGTVATFPGLHPGYDFACA